MQIEVGNIYQFEILAHDMATMPGHLLLKDPYGDRHIINFQPYDHISTQGKDSISCRVDKINCSGKVFLEPLDPHYHEGETYEFPYTRILDVKGFFGERVRVYTISDVYNRTWQVPVDSAHVLEAKPGYIRARVVRIKKGELQFNHPPISEEGQGIEIGKAYLFRVVNETILGDGHTYFVLRDPYGHKQYLAKRHYSPWNIALDQLIECQVASWSTKGFLYLEPKHPYYQQGEVYQFKISWIQSNIDGKHSVKVIDIFGHDIEIDVSSRLLDKVEANTLPFKVLGFRKGIPILDNL